MKKKEFILSLILVIFYIVGVVGISVDPSGFLVKLSALNLLLTMLLILLNHEKWDNSFIIFLLYSMLAGYFIEVIGVSTGLLFGEYKYGATLGFQILQVPLILGVNWFILIYCSSEVASLISKNKFIAAMLASALMVFLDFLIEPIAIRLDFWSWDAGTIPLQNYIAWFLISFCLNYLYLSVKDKQTNKVAIVAFVCQVLFFAILNYTIL